MRSENPSGIDRVAEITTSIRMRYERSRVLDLQSQLEECVDYLEHPEVLLTEFLESYYLVERKLDPEREDARLQANAAELVLESFYPSLELQINGPGSASENVSCIGGAFEPLAGDVHPALSRAGLDYIGMRSGSPRVVLGVVEVPDGDSPYPLILRALSCLAEVAPPFQLARLQRHVLGEHLRPETSFDLQIALRSQERSELATSLLLLTRDLAELFKARMGEDEQFAGLLSRIECLESESKRDTPTPDAPLRVRWRV